MDDELTAFGLKVLRTLRTPMQAPKANAYCELLMGTIRCECLDHVISLSEKHLRTILREWVIHYQSSDLTQVIRVKVARGLPVGSELVARWKEAA